MRCAVSMTVEMPLVRLLAPIKITRRVGMESMGKLKNRVSKRFKRPDAAVNISIRNVHNEREKDGCLVCDSGVWNFFQTAPHVFWIC